MLVWEFVVGWAVILGAVGLFIRHERRQRRQALADKALRFATETKYRYEAPLPDPGLTRVMAAAVPADARLVSRFAEELRRA